MKIYRDFYFSVLVFEVLDLAPWIIMMVATKEPFDEISSWVIGFVEALVSGLICFAICRKLDRIPSTFTGLAIGLVIPPCVALIRGRIASSMASQSPYERFPDPLSLWIGGLIAAIPSGLAGGIVGFTQYRRPFDFNSLSDSK